MKIQSPTVGPLLGHTTDNQARIWLRGDLERTPTGPRRAFGVVQVRQQGASSYSPPQFVPLMPHFDMTGVIVVSGLLPSTNYEYQAGWFYAEAELEDLATTKIWEWKAIKPISFKTGTTDATAKRAYIAGSCRYLLRLFGGSIWDERGDKTFRSILEQIKDGKKPTDGIVLLGDQIYADDLKNVCQDTGIDDYLSRYRLVFGQEKFRELTGQIPTYMILDDHEIEDNWPSKASDRDWITLYPAAIHSYQIYQCSHSPLYDVDKDGRLTGTLSKFWYKFSDGCCDWFVMDSRNERVWSDDPAKRRMIKDSQMKELLAWLNDGSGKVKVIVTSVPFFPDLKSDSDDKWCGFIAERTQILDFILEKKIKKVVTLSGDVHCSFSAELTSPQDPSFKILSIISSSFFWPYPHMDEGDFDLKGTITSNSKNTYQVGSASDVHSTDNFARLEFDPKGVSISFYKRKGDQLGQTAYRSF